MEHGADINAYRTRICIKKRLQPASLSVTNDDKVKETTSVTRHIEKLTPVQVALMSNRIPVVRLLAAYSDLSVPFHIGIETGFVWKLAKDPDLLNCISLLWSPKTHRAQHPTLKTIIFTLALCFRFQPDLILPKDLQYLIFQYVCRSYFTSEDQYEPLDFTVLDQSGLWISKQEKNSFPPLDSPGVVMHDPPPTSNDSYCSIQ